MAMFTGLDLFTVLKVHDCLDRQHTASNHQVNFHVHYVNTSTKCMLNAIFNGNVNYNIREKHCDNEKHGLWVYIRTA